MNTEKKQNVFNMLRNVEDVRQILVVGLGLIGGSIASAIKHRFPQIRIVGLDAKPSETMQALEWGMIDEIGMSYEIDAPNSDVIFFCTPVKQTERFLNETLKIELKPNVIITDVGSTKREVVESAIPLMSEGVQFVGGHPMAGSHKSGIIAANRLLFENAYYLLTPLSENDLDACGTLEELLKDTQAKFLRVTPSEHDKLVGMLSHLPHIIASGLVNQAELFSEDHPEARVLAAGGFRDITRIASSDPIMWTDILLSNQEVLIQLINIWQKNMSQISELIQQNNREAIFDFFVRAKNTRDALPVHNEGAIPAFHDLYLDIPDVPGVIAEVTSSLAEDNISIVNLRVLETREDINGILQISFRNRSEFELGKKNIESHLNYVCYEK